MTTTNPSTAEASRVARIEALLDAALDKVAAQIAEGPVSASLLREVVSIVKDAGVNLAEQGQPTSAAFDSVLASLSDVPEDLLSGDYDYVAVKN